MDPRPDRPLQKHERLNLALVCAIGMLTAVATTCGSCVPFFTSQVGRTPAEQHAVTVQFKVVCAYPDPARPHDPDPAIDSILATLVPDIERTYGASGVLVSSDRALTNAHVVDCDGGKLKTMAINIGDDVWREAKVEIVMQSRELARVQLTTPLKVDIESPVVGPVPKIGDQVCESTAVPLWTYRCGSVQPGGTTTTIYTDFLVLHGNSGSPVSDSRGRLVGLTFATFVCEFGSPCIGAVTKIDADLQWLVSPPRS